MYRYDTIDKDMLADRVQEFREQCARRLAGHIHCSLIDIHGGSVPARVAGIDVVEDVIGLEAQLEPQAFSKYKVLE